MLRWAALAFGLALFAAGSASAELVARGVQDGVLALGPKGTPHVAYVRGDRVVVASRGERRWRSETAARLPSGSQGRALGVGAAGPVALVQGADSRRVLLLRRSLLGWQTIRVVPRLPASVMVGWPGLALDLRGAPVVAYARWSSVNLSTRLLLVGVDSRGEVDTHRLAAGGWPPAYRPPAAEPIVIGKRVHVLESFGWRGTGATLEWFRSRKTWVGLGVDEVRGDWPLRPLLASRTRHKVYAAWTISMLGYGFVPVTLASHALPAVTVHAEFVLDRALTSAFALTPSGPEIAANEWVDTDDLGLEGEGEVWAGVVRGARRVELDGWIAGLAATRAGGRDLLLAGPAGLSWFHSPRRLSTLATLDAARVADGVLLTGTVGGIGSGRVVLYRERPGSPRERIGSTALVDGSYSFADRSPVEPLLYRAVYEDPRTRIPYAALLRPETP